MRGPGSAESRHRRPLRVCFLAEQVLGHRSIVANLRLPLDTFDDLRITWVALDFPTRGPASWRLWQRRHWSLWGSALALLGILRASVRGVPDVLVFHTPTVAQLAWPLMRLIPTVLSLDATQAGMHSLAGAYGHQPPGDSLYDRAVRWTNRAVFRAARACLPMSRWAADSLLADYGVDPAAVVVQPDGVDLRRWRPGVEGERRAAAPAARILFVGGDFDRKGGPLLLEALRGLPESALPWELHLVTGAFPPGSSPPGGAGDEARPTRIHLHQGLTGNDPALLALYRSCDLFVLPTRGDCFPTVVIEAMASGLPVVATSVGGIPEMVVHGETGFLVPPEDAGALRAALARLLADPALRRKMGAAGRRRAEARFDARHYAAAVHRAIRAAYQGRVPVAGAVPGPGWAG